jgi:hypothetical protein
MCNRASKLHNREFAKNLQDASQTPIATAIATDAIDMGFSLPNKEPPLFT